MVDLMFLNFLLLSENIWPISPILQAPRIASVIACNTGSPSEWPKVPTDEGIFLRIKQEEHGVTVVFINLQNTKIELITPLGNDSPLTSFLKKNPNGGIHHICYGVKNIHESQRTLINGGAKLVGDGKPKLGAHGRLVIFLHPRDFNGTLIELEEI